MNYQRLPGLKTPLYVVVEERWKFIKFKISKLLKRWSNKSIYFYFLEHGVLFTQI